LTLERLEREIRLLETYAVVTTILFVVALLAVTGMAQSQRQRFTEIDVERLNVVEPDGRLAPAIANRQRIAAPMIDGKELPRELSQGRVGSAGMIFFDPQGTEAGGLTFRTELRPDGTYTATRSLTFDQHQQDQVVGLQYSDNGKNRGQGLSVWDRPTSITLLWSTPRMRHAWNFWTKRAKSSTRFRDRSALSDGQVPSNAFA
jgi:hypothetical protein